MDKGDVTAMLRRYGSMTQKVVEVEGIVFQTTLKIVLLDEPARMLNAIIATFLSCLHRICSV
jgi:hypothetical protein